jgi:DNA helicase II / ATP-dependent DNA helicase PcrA
MTAYEMNEERSTYIQSRGKIILSACPGSGKTTTVALKLSQITDSWPIEGTSKYSGVACLSFTNVAKDEINQKFHSFTKKLLTYPHFVGTLDSFINQFITLPFYNVFQVGGVRPHILENTESLDSYSFYQFKIGKRPIQFLYPPSQIDFNLEGSYTVNGNRPNLDEAEGKVFIAYCNAVKRNQFRNGLLKNSDSTYIALKILQSDPRVASSLIKRFPYIIIDEAQDTSDIQHEIINILVSRGLNYIDLVGDVYQSLYEFREARPDLFLEKEQSPNWTTLPLSECRRSVSSIVNVFSLFRKPGDDAITSVVNRINDISPVHLLYYSELNSDVLTKYEEIASCYSDRVVLVRGGSHLEALAAKQEDSDYWHKKIFSPSVILKAKSEFSSGNIKSAVNRILRYLPALYDPTCIDDYPKQKSQEEKLRQEYNLFPKIINLLTSVPEFDKTLLEWTIELDRVCREIFIFDGGELFEVKAGNYRKFYDVPISELIHTPTNVNKVTTIHKVKGKSFDSIMLVLSANSSGQNISIRDFVKSTEIPNEKKRMIYVALSRPRYQLVLAIPMETRLSEKEENQIFGLEKEIHVL